MSISAPRRAAEGTSMTVAEIRHCLRDLCKVCGMMDTVKNADLDVAWSERRRAQEEVWDFCGKGGGWGRMHRTLQDIDKLKSPATRVAKAEIVNRESRRLLAVLDDTIRRFGLLEDKRSFVDLIQ